MLAPLPRGNPGSATENGTNIAKMLTCIFQVEEVEFCVKPFFLDAQAEVDISYSKFKIEFFIMFSKFLFTGPHKSRRPIKQCEPWC